MTDDYDETERRLERAAQSADDTARSWAQPRDLILPAEAPHRRGRALYPALSAAAVAAIAITAIGLAATGGDSEPSGGGGPGAADLADAPQHAADALTRLVPGLRDVHITVPQDGSYVVTAQYAPDGVHQLANIQLSVSDHASGIVDCTAFGTDDATAVPPATSSAVVDPDNTDAVLPPDATGTAKLDPENLPSTVDGGVIYPTGAPDRGDEGDSAVTVSPPTITSGTDAPPDASPVSGATVYSCGYGWSSGKGGGTDPGNAADGSFVGESFAVGEIRPDGTQVEIEVDAIAEMTSADKIPDDTLQAVLDSPDVQAGGVCTQDCQPAPSLSEMPLPATVTGAPGTASAVPTRASEQASSAAPPATASDLPLTGPPTTSPSGSATTPASASSSGG